jgi:hypothetical protein
MCTLQTDWLVPYAQMNDNHEFEIQHEKYVTLQKE